MGGSRIISRGVAAALAVCVVIALLAPQLARAEVTFALLPAYPDQKPLGPHDARGAVIWSHGKGDYIDATRLPPPFYLTLLRQAGWDIFRENRIREEIDEAGFRHSVDAERIPKLEALARSIAALEMRGYKRIVLAGQSYGAWLSLMTAGRRDDIYAVIATSPASYGSVKSSPEGYKKNAALLYGIIDRIETGRVVIDYFKDDIFEPEDRGPRSEESLSEHHLPHLVINHPDAPLGHGGAAGRYFAWRFGGCLVDMLDAPRPPSLTTCEYRAPLAPDGDIASPAEFSPAAPQPGAPINPYLGIWYGVYQTGQQSLFAVERVNGSALLARYAWGKLGKNPPGAVRRNGHLTGSGIVIESAENPVKLEYHLKDADTLEGAWSRGSDVHPIVLRRLAPPPDTAPASVASAPSEASRDLAH